MPRVFLVVFLLAASPLLARNVFFVDNAAPPGGSGTREQPFASLTQALGVSQAGDVIYVAEGNGPYEANMTLKQGQMLIGAAYGLDAVAVDLHIPLNVSMPAVQGPGPTIRGTIWLTGGNVVAGCTIVNDGAVAIGTSAPVGPIAIRKTFIRPSKSAAAISLDACSAPVTIDEGGIIAAAPASGLLITGGTADVTIDRFPITGTFTTAVSIRNRVSGAVKFRNGSKIAVDDAREAITIANCKGTISFGDPVTIATHGGRGIAVTASGPVTFDDPRSRITSVNAPAIELHDVRFTATFAVVSAEGIAPGVLSDGIVIDKLSAGKLAITGDGAPASGGTIRNAKSYGIRITQSTGVQLASMAIADSGSATSLCPSDLERETNVRCAAGLYLRHVASSKFTGIDITGGGGEGINANNVRDVVFDAVRVSGSGTDEHDPAVLMQEALGTIAFTRCAFIDAAGGGLVLEQRFNNGRLSFDHCDLGTPTRTGTRPPLVRVRTTGAGTLAVELSGVQLHDHTGSIVSVDASDTSALSLSILQSFGEKFAGRFIDAIGRDRSRIAVAVGQTRVAVPGISGAPLINIDGGDVCADIRGNTLSFGGGAPAIRIRAATLAIVQSADAASIDARSTVYVPACAR